MENANDRHPCDEASETKVGLSEIEIHNREQLATRMAMERKACYHDESTVEAHERSCTSVSRVFTC